MFKIKYLVFGFAAVFVLAGGSLYLFQDHLAQFGPTKKLAACLPGGMPQVAVEMYSLPNCPYCRYAQKLLDQKGTKVNIIDLSQNPDQRHDFLKRTGGQTSVPQIFIDGHHVGGYGHLKALDRKGKLDCFLKCGVNSDC